MLFEVLSAYVDVFHQALPSVSPPLLHGVLGTQSEHCHVFQRQTEAAQASVKLLGITLSHLVTLVLQREKGTRRKVPGQETEELVDEKEERCGKKKQQREM